MNKVAVVTDSVAMLPEQLARDLNVGVMPIILNLGDRDGCRSEDVTPPSAVGVCLRRVGLSPEEGG